MRKEYDINELHIKMNNDRNLSKNFDHAQQNEQKQVEEVNGHLV